MTAIDLPGAVNLRDFGGYGTEDGRRVCRHRLYRSGSLAHLSDTAKHAFAELGIDLICDLRREDEKREEPTPEFSHAPRRIEIPIYPGSAVRMRAAAGRGEMTLADRIEFMVLVNRDLARTHTEAYARMFEALLELEDGAFLVHCSAGKDRTGFACALILHALGVPEETVLEDYLLTNETLDIDGYMMQLLRRHGYELAEDRESLMALIGVRPEYLEAAFDAIESEFVGVEEYLERAIGLDAMARAKLRDRYCE